MKTQRLLGSTIKSSGPRFVWSTTIPVGLVLIFNETDVSKLRMLQNDFCFLRIQITISAEYHNLVVGTVIPAYVHYWLSGFGPWTAEVLTLWSWSARVHYWFRKNAFQKKCISGKIPFRKNTFQEMPFRKIAIEPASLTLWIEHGCVCCFRPSYLLGKNNNPDIFWGNLLGQAYGTWRLFRR